MKTTLEKAATDTARAYHLKLLERFVIHAPDARGVYRWNEWQEGRIVDDQDAIKLLEAHNAPCERIEINPKRPQPDKGEFKWIHHIRTT
jgi:hypothetical protein